MYFSINKNMERKTNLWEYIWPLKIFEIAINHMYPKIEELKDVKIMKIAEDSFFCFKKSLSACAVKLGTSLFPQILF